MIRATRHQRFFLWSMLLLCVACIGWQAPAQAGAPTLSQNLNSALDPALEIVTLPLYADKIPGARGEDAADTPTLTVFRPVHPNGTAVIVAPGGAYVTLAANHEGRQAADWLTELGVTAFVLKYRLGPTYLYPVPLEDARRAVRLVRRLAPKYGYVADRIGMMGFSAGGHLTAMVGTVPESGKPMDPDPVEREGSELNFMVLVYPWLNAMEPRVQGPKGPMINYCSVTRGLTQSDCAQWAAAYTPAAHVSRETPPAIVFHTSDDNTVPVQTSVDFYSAMHKVGAEAELHVFAHGPHGFGMGGADSALSSWPTLLENWMRARGLLTEKTR